MTLALTALVFCWSAQSNIRPTLPDVVAGDITAAMPYRAMVNIINFIQAMDYVVPGFASYETLLYSPELKFYSNDGPGFLLVGFCLAVALTWFSTRQPERT